MDERDTQLIDEFNQYRSEEAFTAVVQRHASLVFGTALRLVGDHATAEDVTQSVFVALARSAGKLGEHGNLAGWLYRTTLNKSRERLRSELRRARREAVAWELGTIRSEGDLVWVHLLPLLDEALLELRESDRAVVQLHFMEELTFRELGRTLGVGEDAVRKRVSRSVDQLASFFRRRGFAVALVIAAVLPLLGCGPKAPRDTQTQALSSAPASKPLLVELAEVQRGMIEEVLERSCSLQAEAQVLVLARTQNPAVELLVEEGDKVTRGQVLLRLENDRQTTDYKQTRSQLEKARIDFDTAENLHSDKLISESDYRSAKFAFHQAQFQAEAAKRQLDYTEVRAPISGTVTSRTVTVGDQVNTGTPTFEIVDLASIVAIIHVPEQYLPKLKPNMRARLLSATLGDRVYAGFVKRVAPIVDAQAGTVKAVVGVKELGELRPGLWVDVELVLDSKSDALLIPKRSIVYDNDQTYTFKAYTDERGVLRVKRERVLAINADEAHIEPTAGFVVGDRIVVAGQSGLKDGAPIREIADPAASDLSVTKKVALAETNPPPTTSTPRVQGAN